jgi:hypothetical protein
MVRFTLLASLIALPAAAQDWESVSNRQGINVTWRKVPDSKLREIRATGIVDFSAERLFTALADAERFPEIMPPTEALKILHRQGTTLWMHVVISPPLVSRRDYCVRGTYERLPDGSLLNRWVQTDEYCPPPLKGIVRMTHTEGRWQLMPRDGGKTEVLYQGITDPAGSLPAWIVNRATARSMTDMFGALRKAAAQPRYADCKDLFVCPLVGPRPRAALP